MKLIKDITLGYKEGTSDKVYNIKLYETEADGRFHVICYYGRRGSSLKEVVKAWGVSLETANLEFEKVFHEKWKKGYRTEDASPPAYMRARWVAPTTVVGIVPPVCRTVEPIEQVEPVEQVAEATPVVCKTDSLTCSEDARSKALARLRAASA